MAESKNYKDTQIKENNVGKTVQAFNITTKTMSKSMNVVGLDSSRFIIIVKERRKLRYIWRK